MLHGSVIAWLAAGVTAWFVLMWYLVPLWLRLRRNAEWEEDHGRPVAAREHAAAAAGRRPAADIGETIAGADSRAREDNGS